MTRYFYDGEIEREWPAEGLLLKGLPTRVRRAVAWEWMKYILPSSVGSDKFETITQHRSLWAKHESTYFSTCGELPMFLLEMLGYRGKMLNRNIATTDPGGPRKYMPGRNMELLMGHLSSHSPSRVEGAWHAWPGFGAGIVQLPETGDIICVTEGPPRTEHVMVSMDLMLQDKHLRGLRELAQRGLSELAQDGTMIIPDSIYVAEAGRGGTFDQHGGFDKKELHARAVGGRTCVGFVSIGDIELTVPAQLPPEPAAQ